MFSLPQLENSHVFFSHTCFFFAGEIAEEDSEVTNETIVESVSQQQEPTAMEPEPEPTREEQEKYDKMVARENALIAKEQKKYESWKCETSAGMY